MCSTLSVWARSWHSARASSTGSLETLERLGLLDDLAHFLFDAWEIFLANRRLDVDVVIEAVLDGRTEGELGAGKEPHHRAGHDVSTAVAQHLKGVGVLLGQHLERMLRRRLSFRAATGTFVSTGGNSRSRSTISPSNLAAMAAWSSRLPMLSATRREVISSGKLFVCSVGKFQGEHGLKSWRPWFFSIQGDAMDLICSFLRNSPVSFGRQGSHQPGARATGFVGRPRRCIRAGWFNVYHWGLKASSLLRSESSNSSSMYKALE